ncbi:hypothetical protein Cadr_000020021 [Camelus dromedarius]|uniref:Uncharacterized protein n=1 Tax=Camelus dromedarius TaxID=9838 RepID=A0A5N4CZT8_CAMDR|nr:hypothetical protein Cadr_000020021 [Camelus dromedarius]
MYNSLSSEGYTWEERGPPPLRTGMYVISLLVMVSIQCCLWRK